MKKLASFLLACALCLAGLLPALAEDGLDEQDLYWVRSGREALWNALYAEGGTVLTEEEAGSFLSAYAGTLQMYDADEEAYGFFRIGEGAAFRAELSAWEEKTAVSGRITGVIRLSDWVYALELGEFEWEEDAFPELVQAEMLFQVPGVTGESEGFLVFETEYVAEALGLDPDAPSAFCVLTAFDSSPTWYRAAGEEE